MDLQYAAVNNMACWPWPWQTPAAIVTEELANQLMDHGVITVEDEQGDTLALTPSLI